MSSCSVRIRLRNGPARLRLIDHRMQLVAEGYGELAREDLVPGLYVLEIDAGSRHEEKILSLGPGEDYRDLALEVAFPSPVPMAGTSTGHTYHANPAAALSRTPNLRFGDGGRLMVFVRNLGEPRDQPIDFQALSLLDAQLVPLGSDLFAAHDAGKPADGWAGLCADLAPGGYALGCSPSSENHEQGSSGPSQQSLWVSAGWTTLVFVPCMPGQGRPIVELASIHLTHLGEGFHPFDHEAQQSNLAAELALNGLRSGQRLVPSGLLDVLLHSKFHNPMLGILGAHVLLQDAEPPWQLFDLVVSNLREMLGFHPDAEALHVLGQLRRGDRSPSQVQPAAWPPMVAAAYRALIRRDAQEPGLIAAESVADYASARLYPSGPWSRWSALEPLEPLAAAMPETAMPETTMPETTMPETAMPEADAQMPVAGDHDLVLGRHDAEAAMASPSEAERAGIAGRTFRGRGRGLGASRRSGRGDAQVAPPPASGASKQHQAETDARRWVETMARQGVSRATRGLRVRGRGATSRGRERVRSPEAEQVAGYLRRMAEQSRYGDGRADLESLDVRHLSQRVGLPVATVRRAIATLAEQGFKSAEDEPTPDPRSAERDERFEDRAL